MDYIFVIVIYISVIIVHSIAGFDNDFKPENIEVSYNSRSNNSGNFSFKDCGVTESNLNFTSMSVLPDPIELDRYVHKTISISGNYSVKTNISEKLPIEVDLRLRMRSTSGYMEICELIGEQFCHIDDLMAKLNHSLPLPITEGDHSIFFPVIPLPKVPFILRGTFEASAFIKQEGRPLGCLFVQFCTTECISY